ncbi:MAG TPA: rhodanese-like domain-containing protein [Actinomycetota bacterium]|nr:rhodanese-like domain-containing protein [Actinomycetota bacterium]
MDAAEAQALRGKATFLDVREPYEYAAGHVEGSLHVPIGQIAARWEEVPRDGRIVVVCQVGQRSGLVADFLRARGLDAHNLEGGLEAWLTEGYELTSEGHPGEVAEGFARDLSGERLNPE